MRNQKIAVFGLLSILWMSAVAMPARSQSFEQVRAAMARYDLRGALSAARDNAAANPSDAIAQQVQGILETAVGDPHRAEDAFSAAIAQGDAIDPTPTGLEKFDFEGSPLRQALNRQKVSIALGAGGAAAYNNRGAIRIVLGRVEDGLDDLDQAMSHRPGWGTPSANVAVAWLENNSPRLAKRYARQALNDHEQTAKVYTSLAEAQMRQKLWKDAEESFKEAEDRDNGYAYELYVRSQWYYDEQQPRDQQRALFQALALDPDVASEDRYKMTNQLHMGGGNGSADYEHLFNNGRLGALETYQSTIQRDRGLQEDEDGSYQRRDYSQSVFGHTLGEDRPSLLVSFLNDNGGRPGGVDQLVVPDATFGFRRANLALFQDIRMPHGAQFILSTIYRHNHVEERSSATAPVFNPLDDDQFGFEGRFTTPVTKSNSITLGYAWMQTKRTLGLPPPGDPLAPALPDTGDIAYRVESSGVPAGYFASPVEPNGQLLQAGTSVLTTAYAIGQRPLSPKAKGAFGPVVAANGRSVFMLPYADVHLAQSPKLTYRLAALPRIMNANSDLLPVGTLPDPLQSNPLGQPFNSAPDIDPNPYLAGPDGRVISYEFTVKDLVGNGSWLTGTAFYRHFSDMEVLSQDPTISPALVLTDEPNGSATGIDVSYTQPLPAGLSLQLGGTIETSKGSYDASGAPKTTTLPYAPSLQGLVGLGYENGGIQVSVNTIEVGSRTSIEQTPLPGEIGLLCGNCNYATATVAASTEIAVTVIDHLPDGREIIFTAQPVSSAGYYFNYPLKPLVSLGFDEGF